MVEELIRCLAEQKSLYDFKDLDFEADLVQLYTNIRVMMAERYSENKEFGPVSEKEIEQDLTAAEIAKAKIKREEEKKAIRAGYVRIKAKAKKIRQNYRKTVTEGQKPGSGRVVCNHWEELKALWGGSLATVVIRNAVISTKADQDDESVGKSIIDGLFALAGAVKGSPTPFQVQQPYAQQQQYFYRPPTQPPVPHYNIPSSSSSSFGSPQNENSMNFAYVFLRYIFTSF